MAVLLIRFNPQRDERTRLHACTARARTRACLRALDLERFPRFAASPAPYNLALAGILALPIAPTRAPSLAAYVERRAPLTLATTPTLLATSGAASPPFARSKNSGYLNQRANIRPFCVGR